MRKGKRAAHDDRSFESRALESTFILFFHMLLEEYKSTFGCVSRLLRGRRFSVLYCQRKRNKDEFNRSVESGRERGDSALNNNN